MGLKSLTQFTVNISKEHNSDCGTAELSKKNCLNKNYRKSNLCKASKFCIQKKSSSDSDNSANEN